MTDRRAGSARSSLRHDCVVDGAGNVRLARVGHVDAQGAACACGQDATGHDDSACDALALRSWPALSARRLPTYGRGIPRAASRGEGGRELGNARLDQFCTNVAMLVEGGPSPAPTDPARAETT